VKISPDKEVIALIAYIQQLGRYKTDAPAPGGTADAPPAPSMPPQASR